MLRDANLSNAYLNYADLSEANLTRTDFTGADLSNAYLNDVDLSQSNLTAVKLAGADLTGAILNGVKYYRDAIFCNTSMPDGVINNSDC